MGPLFSIEDVYISCHPGSPVDFQLAVSGLLDNPWIIGFPILAAGAFRLVGLDFLGVTISKTLKP